MTDSVVNKNVLSSTDSPAYTHLVGVTKVPPGCTIEEWAVVVLGYTQASWDNKSGKEQQPSSSQKYWTQLTARERAAALALGYTQWKWDKGDKEHEPASANKDWAELTACGE